MLARFAGTGTQPRWCEHGSQEARRPAREICGRPARRRARSEVQEGRRDGVCRHRPAAQALRGRLDLPRRAAAARCPEHARIGPASTWPWSACRWTSASPTGRAPASGRAPCGRSSASGPIITCTSIAPLTEVKCADVGDVPFRSRFSLSDSHEDIEAFFARMAAAGVTPGQRRRRPLDQPADPQGAGRRPAARHGAHRCARRHQRPLRRRQVPSRRPVPAGRAGRRARPRAHHPDRHPRRRRVSVGVLLRQRHDRHPRRRGVQARHRPHHREDRARSSARGRPTSPSTSTASIRPSRRAPAPRRSAA